MRGSDLRFGYETMHAQINQVDLLIDMVKPLLATHAKRAAVAAECQSKGIDGFIDATAQRLLELTGWSAQKVVDLLKVQRTLSFSYGDKGAEGEFAWNGGTIVGSFYAPGKCTYLTGGAFIFSEQLPETYLASLVGKPLKSLVEGPCYPTDAKITAVRESNALGTWLDLDIERLPLQGVSLSW
jgi:hypothetical protein